MQRITSLVLLGAVIVLGAGSAVAEPREYPGRRGGEMHEQRAFVPRGSVVSSIPRGGYEVRHGGGHYWYHGGNWYSPRGPRWTVVTPPWGLFVPVLPGFYSTLWWGGVPYYYANDVYYVWRQEHSAYEVVPPPDSAEPETITGPTDLFIYPRNGQDDALQSEDRYQCHRWANEQTHFDPTRPGGGLQAHTEQARIEYLRAMSACLEGRGYTVK
jgi:hypothetical protein